MHAILLLVIAGLLSTGCGLIAQQQARERRAVFFREVKALRPHGSGDSGYGLATGCVPGRCWTAQKEYHWAYQAIMSRYGVPFDTYGGTLFSYAEAVADRVDRGEIPPVQADALIQEVRLRIRAQYNQEQMARRQMQIAEEALFLQQIQSLQPSIPTPIVCTTRRLGTVVTTTCQ